jgi:hypothetical protein
MAMAGVGGIVGGIAMSAWGGPQHNRALWTILLVAVVGVFVALTGIAPSLFVVSTAAFLTMVVLAVIYSVGQAFWQLKTDPAYQGRVFALRNMFAMLAMPIAYLLAGPLADQVFEPAMMGDSGLATVFGPVVGTGQGRGLGLMCVLAGLLSTIVSLLAATIPTLRRLDTDVPNHEPEAEPA